MTSRQLYWQDPFNEIREDRSLSGNKTLLYRSTDWIEQAANLQRKFKEAFPVTAEN
ncbi:MAG: hypothetical protein AAFX78_12665 [Cyanobacteria bacterium J06638_20]